MNEKISSPSIIESAGNKPKVIEEYVGRVNSGTNSISIAKMSSPSGWKEPGQKPQFDEYTIVLRGTLKVESRTETLFIKEGEAVIVNSGEWYDIVPQMKVLNTLPYVYLHLVWIL